MNKEIKEIKVSIKTKLPRISWEKLKGYEFNALKEAENRDVSKLKNSIVNRGFKFPLYIWERYVIDGAGRDKALFELETEGYEIPDLPYIELEAENLGEAKKLALLASSQHGKITKESYFNFIEDIEVPELEINLSEINFEINEIDDLPDINFNKIESNKNREKKHKIQYVSCPACKHSFEVQI